MASQKSNAEGSNASEAAEGSNADGSNAEESNADASKTGSKADPSTAGSKAQSKATKSTASKAGSKAGQSQKSEATTSYAGSTASSAASGMSGASKSSSAATSSAGSTSNTAASDMDSSMADATVTMASEMSMKSDMQERNKMPEEAPKAGLTGRKVYVMRHAERMDRIFHVWLRLAFTDEGKYRPYDLNMPLILPKRSDGIQAYHNDTPITEMGSVASQMLGRGLRLNKVRLTHVLCSPALRSVQTGQALLKAYANESIKLCVEPGLFEWLGWYESTPTWMNAEELETHQLRVDTKYKPVMTEEELCQCAKETEKQFYERSDKVIKKIMEKLKDAGSILIVGHGATVDASCRPLMGRKMTVPSKAQFDKMGLLFPYNSLVGLEELNGGQWRMLSFPVPPITYLDFTNRIDSEFFNRA